MVQHYGVGLYSMSALELSVSTGPEDVAAPIVTDVTASTVRLTWQRPTQPNGVIISYFVYENEQLAYNVRRLSV